MYRKKGHIHFVGIGGIGMSGIATILKHQGYTISGCDSDLSQPSITLLKGIGCSIYQDNNTSACHDSSIDLLVYSSAIAAKNPEITAAQQRGIPTIPRALMLAELMRTKYSVAIAGAHGKTTTTSLISHILIEAQMDPTVIIGGHLKNLSTNARIGQGDFLVAEADESDRSLLNLHATLAVITNIDLEHLETYKDLEDIKHTFMQFLNNLPFYGKAIMCMDDPVIQSILPIPHIKTVSYGITSNADYKATNIQLNSDHVVFTVYSKNDPIPFGQLMVPMPGVHNVLNSLAATVLALDLQIPFSTIASALKTFKGVERRFSYRGTFKGAELFDDYGHHPREIEHTLAIARARSKNKLTVIFQPHRYTRTHKLWDLFIETLANSSMDNLIITDIYPASETPIPGVTASEFTKALKGHNPSYTVTYVPYDAHFYGIKEAMKDLINPDDLILFLGAGKINKLAYELAQI
jgi:UDP-N-acetylmuramate--alanine ligase